MANINLPKTPFDLKNPLDAAQQAAQKAQQAAQDLAQQAQQTAQQVAQQAQQTAQQAAQQAQQTAQQAADAVGQLTGKFLSPLMKFNQAFFESCLQPERLPPGAQDAYVETASSVQKPPPGTNPVVLIHGTLANRYNTFRNLSPEIKAAGFAVFALNFGGLPTLPKVIGGAADIRESAKELARFVDDVLSKTGAKKVDLVGHSQGGGILPRWYIKYLGGKDKVDKLIGVAPGNHGCSAMGLSTLTYMICNLLRIQNIFSAPANALVGPALLQQTDGSPSNLHPELDEGGDCCDGVHYVNIVTIRDEAVTPYGNGYLKAGDGQKVTNLTLQDYDGYKFDMTEHLGMTSNPVVIELVKRALAGKPVDTKSVMVTPSPLYFTP
ncbi:lipase family alpha/beta hydrolase [Pendulispora albinea]|uniref:Alpha/beta fold hydrolase n=1 Tax=Pendulispora albinea TaxID=2741071 RepID=A0ABZ2LQ20_9BACT